MSDVRRAFRPVWAAQPGPQMEAICARWCQELFYGGAAGGGKALDVATPIATPFGWSVMGELAVGDMVFAETGEPCRVLAVSPIMKDRPCYRLTFSDGAVIVADAEHRWLTLDASERASHTRRNEEFRARRRAARPSRAKAVSQKPWVSRSVTEINRQRVYEYKAPSAGTVRTTADIAQTLYHKRGALNHSIAVAGPLQCADGNLPIDPYVLGAWLGDGTTRSASITTADEEILSAIAGAGYQISPRAHPINYGIPGQLQTQLRMLGLLGNKHIPAVYQRASVAQRIALLQGLMDTDGYCDVRGKCEFSITRKQLADDAHELLISLGIKTTMRVGKAMLNGRVIGPKYSLSFRSEIPAFRLARKLIRQKRGGFRGTHNRRYIVACDLVPSVPVRCIAVDSPSHLYLAGREMVPTHNSDYLLADFLQDVPTYGAAWQGIIFRKSYTQLSQLMKRAHELFPQTSAWWNEQSKTYTWSNGASLKFRYLDQEIHRLRYQGHEFTWIGWDELTHWATDAAYRFLRGRLRSSHDVPYKRIRAAGNPGGPGHHWVKSYFISPAPGGYERLVNPVSGMSRMFVPAKLTDNLILMEADPEYAHRLKDVGSDALVKALLHGDWDIVEGAFFDCWSSKMVIPPAALPKDWIRFRSADWGSASPFSIGWWAVVQEDWQHPRTRQILPRGALVRYREWYGTKDPAASGSKGLKLMADQVGKGIVEREEFDPKLSYGVLDPATFKQDGGPPISEGINMELIKAGLVPFYEADNTRVPRNAGQDRRGPMSGWDQMRVRMVGLLDDSGEPIGRPMVYCFNTCVASIRTIPVIQHDPARIEDVDTHSEDHAADDWRYGCSSRPWLRDRVPVVEPRDGYRDGADEDFGGDRSDSASIQVL